MTLAEEVKDIGRKVGFSAIGIIARRRFGALPTGSVFDVIDLASPAEVLADAESMIVCGYEVWDSAFNLAVMKPGESGGTDFHQLYSDAASAMAWEVAHFLWTRGHDAVPARKCCLKKAAVLAGLGSQGKNTVVVSPEFGTSLRLSAILTTARLEEDRGFERDLCGDCVKCIEACPTKALSDRSIDKDRCMVYAAENPGSSAVTPEVRAAEGRFIRKPTENAFIECTICLAACPIGRGR